MTSEDMIAYNLLYLDQPFVSQRWSCTYIDIQCFQGLYRTFITLNFLLWEPQTWRLSCHPGGVSRNICYFHLMFREADLCSICSQGGSMVLVCVADPYLFMLCRRIFDGLGLSVEVSFALEVLTHSSMRLTNRGPDFSQWRLMFSSDGK